MAGYLDAAVSRTDDWGDGWNDGYAAGLDAARETVTDVGICTCTGSAWHGHDGSDDRCPVPIVLAAIDALRGER